MDWFGDKLKLPQHDDDRDDRAEALAAARQQYVYDEHKLNLPGIRLGYDPQGSASATWILGAAKLLAASMRNALAILSDMDDHDHDHPSEEEEVKQLEDSGSPVTAAIRAVMHLNDDKAWAEDERRPSSIDDYDRLFQTIDLPAIARGKGINRPCFGDEFFCRYRLMGSNPGWIRRLSDGLPDDYAPLERFGAATGDPAAFARAHAAGRVFTADYSLLLGLDPRPGGCEPPPAPTLEAASHIERPPLELLADDPQAWRAQLDRWIAEVHTPWRAAYAEREREGYGECEYKKVLSAPVGLFQLSEDGTALEPVGIQLAPATGGETPRIYTPADGWAWQQAKAHLQMADGNVHQSISHLAETHIVSEACCLAMYTCMAPNHPLHHLLAPHFAGTMRINMAADQALLAPNEGVDLVLGGTIGSSIAAVHAGLSRYDFNAKMLPNELSERGFGDEVSAKLHYSYRADALGVWEATHAWVRGYVEHYYRTDADVAGDRELAQFTARLAETLAGVGEGGKATVTTRTYLIDMVTHIIFTASAQHAAVNFPQSDLMLYAPCQPLAMYNLDSRQALSEQDFLACLPPLRAAQMQMDLGHLLGGLHYTTLGEYPQQLIGHYFQTEAIRDLNDGYCRALAALETEIDARISAGIDNYHYLRVSEIPMAVNI